MVGPISLFSETRCMKANNHNHDHARWVFNHEKLDVLGILAFDTAKSMARLVSLYKSLSYDQIQRLREEIMKTKGVSYLVSNNEGFLLTLACAERVEELDKAANVVARLGLKCSDYGLVRFGQVYKDLKRGYVDMSKLNNYGSREMEKYVAKMEKLTSVTGELYAELEALAEIESSERKLNDWRKKNSNSDVNYDLFDQKVYNQRKIVCHLKEVSLWNKSYDKIVGLMAKIVCVLYARIRYLFGPFTCKCQTKNGHNSCGNKLICQRLFNDHIPQASMSGPINSQTMKVPLVRFLSRDSNVFIAQDVELHVLIGQRNYQFTKHSRKVLQLAPNTTVGGSGLANRYANVVLLMQRYLNSDVVINDQARQNLYNMLPSSLKKYVRSKLRNTWKEIDEEVSGCDGLAKGWRDALNEIMDWLVPIAQDTITWQAERNLEKQRFDARPTILLMQTLHYADLVKTEAAIAEVLVGLSCVYWYENHRDSSLDVDIY